MLWYFSSWRKDVEEFPNNSWLHLHINWSNAEIQTDSRNIITVQEHFILPYKYFRMGTGSGRHSGGPHKRWTSGGAPPHNGFHTISMATGVTTRPWPSSAGDIWSTRLTSKETSRRRRYICRMTRASLESSGWASLGSITHKTEFTGLIQLILMKYYWKVENLMAWSTTYWFSIPLWVDLKRSHPPDEFSRPYWLYSP